MFIFLKIMLCLKSQSDQYYWEAVDIIKALRTKKVIVIFLNRQIPNFVDFWPTVFRKLKRFQTFLLCIYAISIDFSKIILKYWDFLTFWKLQKVFTSFCFLLIIYYVASHCFHCLQASSTIGFKQFLLSSISCYLVVSSPFLTFIGLL